MIELSESHRYRNHNRIKTILIVALSILYPFHYVVPTPVGRLNISLGDIIIFCIIFLFLLGVVGNHYLPKYIALVSLFSLICVVSLFIPLIINFGFPNYINLTKGISEVVKLIGAAVWAMGIYLLIINNEYKQIWVFTIVSIIMATIFAIITIFQGLSGSILRPSGPFANPNLYGNYLSMNLFFCGMCVYMLRSNNSNKQTALFLFISPILLLGLLITGSRGAIGAFLTASVCAVLFILKTHNSRNDVIKYLTSKFSLIFYPLFVLIAYIIYKSNLFFVDRFVSTFQGSGPNIETRTERYLSGVETFLQNPLFGVGYFQEPSYAAFYQGVFYGEIHNTYLSVAAGTGIIGIAAFFYIFVNIFRDFNQIYAKNITISLFIVSGIVATLVQGLFTNVENFRSLWILVGILSALIESHGT